uniref:RING-type domain-containing protein n=1 Tax=viral metagenome TaxID=1070528 RepID=A0A6C0IXN1_9ZZZZ
MYEKINIIYNNKIFFSLLKNDCIIYGDFIRTILFNDINLEDYLSSQSSKNYIKCFGSYKYKDIIERDLHKHTSSCIDEIDYGFNVNLDKKTYIVKDDKLYYFLEITYIKAFTHLITQKAIVEKYINLDIDSLYIDRNGIGILTSCYLTHPNPFYKVTNNIINKKFKIVKDILDINLFEHIQKLKASGWKNTEAYFKSYDNLSNDEKINLVNNNCGICYQQFNNEVIKLPCNHIFHVDCFNQYILSNLNKDSILCPYCVRRFSIKNLI